MDRKTTKQAELSLNFIDFIVAPLFVALTNLIPDAKHCCSTMNSNRKQWEAMMSSALAASKVESAVEKDEKLKVWGRRKTAFRDVIMPMVAQISHTEGDSGSDIPDGEREKVDEGGMAAETSSDASSNAPHSMISSSSRPMYDKRKSLSALDAFVVASALNSGTPK
jgi:hypothetical protein